MKMYIWNKKIEVEVYLTETELKELINSNQIEIHKDFGYLGNNKLLETLKTNKIVPNYIKIYSMKLITNKSYFGENTYKLHVYYTQKLI